MLASTVRRLAAQAVQSSSSPLQQLLRGALSAAASTSTSSSSTAASTSSWAHSFASSAAEYELAPRPYDVPEGHAKSDLSPHVCNIGLNRRRDLTLRADVMLYGKQATGTSLASLFKVETRSEENNLLLLIASASCRFWPFFESSPFLQGFFV